jgi:bacteriorhodopsin
VRLMNLRTTVASFAVALGIVCALWVFRFQIRGPAISVLLVLLWPAYWVSFLVSGSPHHPNEAVAFVLQVIEVFAIVLLVVLVVRRLRRPRTSEPRE